MPYANPEKRRAAKAEWMRKKRAEDQAYREAENKARVERYKQDADADKKNAEWRAANPERAKEIRRGAAKRWWATHLEIARTRRRATDKARATKKKATPIGEAEHATAGMVVLS